MVMYRPYILRHAPNWTDASNNDMQSYQRCVRDCVQRTGINSGWCQQRCMPPVTATQPSSRVLPPRFRYESRFMQSYPMATDDRSELLRMGVWPNEEWNV